MADEEVHIIRLGAVFIITLPVSRDSMPLKMALEGKLAEIELVGHDAQSYFAIVIHTSSTNYQDVLTKLKDYWKLLHACNLNIPEQMPEPITGNPRDMLREN